MNPKEITLFMFDTEENFNATITQKRLAPRLWKSVVLIQNIGDFSKEIEALGEGENLVLACHVFHSDDYIGYFNLVESEIEEKFGIDATLVSSGVSGEVMKGFFDATQEPKAVHRFASFRKNVKEGEIPIFVKERNNLFPLGKALKSPDPTVETHKGKFKYAIITALLTDEATSLNAFFNFEELEELGEFRIRKGVLRADQNVEVVFGVQPDTGMVDASVLSTFLIEKYKPAYLIMPGVCGGAEDLNLLDIVVATKVFAFQKGKLKDYKNKDGKKNELFCPEGHPVNSLFDGRGSGKNEIPFVVEDFSRELDSLPEINTGLKQRLEGKKSELEYAIKAEFGGFVGGSFQIHFEPMACSTMVIDKEDYFNKNIKGIHRKTAAVEMESYGVARACKLANEGKTKFLIIKSVMDNTTGKTDEVKNQAAQVSACFLGKILEMKLLP